MIIISTVVVLAATTIQVVGAQELISGKATYYGGNENGGACGYNDLPKSSYPYGYSAAIGGNNFDNGYGCGGCYEITCIGPYSSNPGCHCDASTPTVTVWASDQCPECSDTHFDLNPAAMERIVGDGLAGTCGEIEITIERVSCDFTSNIKIRAKSGTSSYWYGLHVDDVAGYGTISSVHLQSTGSSSFDSTCSKSEGASFWKCDGGYPLNFPLTVKLTDERGRELARENVIGTATGGAEWDFGTNFESADDLSSPSTPTTPTTPTSPTTPTAPTTPTSPTPPAPSPGELLPAGNCLSGYTTVTVWDGGSGGKEKEIFLNELQIGDEILVDAAQKKYEEVYTFGHRNAREEASFLQIKTSSLKAPLEITSDHLLYKMEESSLASVPVRADSIKIGDFLASSNKQGGSQLVINITSIKRQGLYSPLTKNGIFLVNGLKVSSYTAIQDVDPQYLKIGNVELFSHHILSHAAAAPLRFVCGSNTRFSSSNLVGGIICHERNDQGRLFSVVMAERIALWWLEQNNMVFQGVIIATLTMLFVPFFGMEQIMKIGGSGCAGAFQFTWLVLVVVVGIIYFQRCQTKIHNHMI